MSVVLFTSNIFKVTVLKLCPISSVSVDTAADMNTHDILYWQLFES